VHFHDWVATFEQHYVTVTRTLSEAGADINIVDWQIACVRVFGLKLALNWIKQTMLQIGHASGYYAKAYLFSHHYVSLNGQ
jgi:hypothetical protein